VRDGLCTPSVLVVIGLLVMSACRHSPEATPAAFPVADRTADCLPDLPLVDATGRPFTPASLLGRPLLFDFVYASCPGPCVVLTSRMAAVAKQLGHDLGATARIVSVTVDPEHDGPPELLRFARAQGADLDGWSFVTGRPEDIDTLMARFRLTREHGADGPLHHVLEIFLVGPDGHPLRQYVAARADPAAIADDVRRASRGEHFE